ncbi:helix-turn-helix domain-containing protein [Pontivivens ytuae]|uniref:Helix-turn-helix transcriptional regulator n=1 Tax=Pontivivens ytuae TaxID=2789856 RepID=A0A7S9LW32_9RHOB|nr:helix-turn-helix transcriptional regulator [Pontivivens ytuae]QPH56179.1 helix-turn-helix transcriptional regulator [Pontivivens ytuae]
MRFLGELRAREGLSQADLAKRLSKPPSFVGKYETYERRLDVIEFLVVLRTLKSSFSGFEEATAIKLPEAL